MTTSERSTRRTSRASTSSARTPSPAQMDSAAWRVKPSACTASRRSTIRSGSVSRSQLQSIVARSVCCRGGTPRCPADSRRNRSSSRATSSCTLSARTREAASSRGSGMPSSRRQSTATAPASSDPSVNPVAAAVARATKSWTALDCSSGGTTKTASPVSPSGSRLVARMRSSGAVRSSAAASSATGSTTCSQLSSTSSRRSLRSAPASRSIRPIGPFPRGPGGASSRMPRTVMTASAGEPVTSSLPGRPSPASSTSHTPSGNLSTSCAAVSTASRVLPTPPGPVSVTSRPEPSNRRTSLTASARPTRSVSGTGRVGRPGQRRILLQDRQLEGGQLGAGVQAELPRQVVSQVAVGRQCLALSPGTVEGTHVRGAQSLSQRISGHQLTQLVGQQAMLAQLESSLGMELQRRQPLLVQPGDGGLGEFLLAEVGQRRAAPQSQRLDEQRRPGLGVLSLVRERHQVPEPLRVDRVVAGPKEIARWLVHHQVSAARLGLFQRPPQLRDLGLQRVDRIARRPPAPQGFGQPVDRHWPPLLDQQTGQQIGQQRTDLQVRDLDRLPVRPPHRQRTEHSETHSSHRTRGARRSTVRRPSADRARLSADWTADVVTNDRGMCLVHANAILGLRAGRREWIGLAVLTLPCLLYAMDLTVLNLAVPHLSADLRPSSVQLLWIVDVYGFLVAGLLITMGTLGDRIGRRRLLLAGAAAFGVASLLAASSTSAGMLIAARALLGVAGATVAPSTLSLIRNMFLDPRQRTVAISVWITSFSVGGAIGPLAGGVLLEWFWWGSVFLLAVPVMALLLVLGPILLPEFRDPQAGRLDLVSAGMSLVAVLAVVWGLKQLAQDGPGWPIRCWTCGCFGCPPSARP